MQYPPTRILLHAAETAQLPPNARLIYLRAEARVAVGIGRGLSPKEIAVAHGSSWHTVRAQLRLVFAKTETRTQSALARLVTLREAELVAEAALGSRRPPHG